MARNDPMDTLGWEYSPKCHAFRHDIVIFEKRAKVCNGNLVDLGDWGNLGNTR